MKIRFAQIRNLVSGRAKGPTYGILLLLAFAVPRFDHAQDKPAVSGPSRSSPAPAKNANAGNIAKGVPGTTAIGTLPAKAIKDVKIAPEDGKLTVTVETEGLVAPSEFILDNPPRLVLDFPNTENKVQFSRLPVHAASVKRLRVQQFQDSPSPIARVVFDLEEPSGTHEVNVDKNAVRLVFHKGQTKLNPAGAEAVAKPAPSQSATAKPTAPEPMPKRNVAPEPAKKAIGEMKPVPAEATQSPAASAPLTTQSAKNAVASTKPKPRPMGSAEKTPVAPALVPFQPAQVLARSELPKEAVKVPAASASAQAVQPQRNVSRPELPKLAVASGDPKIRLAEAAAKDPLPPAPLVAALTPASIATPPKMMMPSPNSRFSGQPLTLDLIDIPLVDFVRLMAEEGGINVVLDPEVKGHLSIKVVKVPWDQIFEAALANNGLDKQVEGTLVRIARKSTLQEEAKQQEALKKATLLAADLETRVKRLNYTKAGALVNALMDQKTVRGTIVVEERTNSLILTDLPSSIAKLNQLIETLDVPQAQVEIEARIVSATRDFARDIGIQFGFVDGNLQRVTVGGPNTFGTIGGTRPSATPTSTFAAGDATSGRGASESSASESAGISTGVGANDKGNWNVNLPANKAFGGIGISLGNIFDTFLLDAAITAGESKGLAKLISQPKVTAQNNSAATITQGLRFPVQIIANNTITVQFQNAALTLTVTPQITYEGNIVLDLKVENNTPDFGRAVNNIPSIRTSESSTRVLVSDGGTTVIGGILIDDEATQEDKVPGLGSLPLVGNLFRRNSVSRSTQEVLFFVTPRIVK